MVSIRVNGEQSQVPVHGGLRVTDLVELIKSVIDPDQMITSIRIDGNELSEPDWRATLGAFGTSIVEFETGEPSAYVRTKISVAPEVVQACTMGFKESRISFKQLSSLPTGPEYNGMLKKANDQFSEAARTLHAFFEWYVTTLQLANEKDRADFNIDSFMIRISEIGSRMSQQQMYQSWWALTETVQRELEPALEELETTIRGMSEAGQPALAVR